MKYLLLALALGVMVQDRPWMRCDPENGKPCPEKSCAIQAEVERLRRENPDMIIKSCACQHTCDPMNEHADATNGRGWDAMCETRCNPDNCQCPHPCDS